MSDLKRMGEIEEELKVRSWRIRDYAKRHGIKPAARIANIDLYGPDAIKALKAGLERGSK